jgi:RHS repeat-associated protein
VLDTFTESTVTEAGVSARTEFCFDGSTGFLERTRTLEAGTARGPDDVIARFTRSDDGKGNLKTEEYFGGDGASLGTGILCGLALPASQYRIDHTYEHGSLKTSQAAPNVSFKSVERDIDLNTGLPRRSADVSGTLWTAYEYDALGRPTWVKPPQESWTRTSYTRATGPAALAEVYVASQPNGGGTALAESKVLFDALGRPWREQRRMPDGTWSSRDTAYNAIGWTASVSEQGNTAQKTQFLGYDPFGRPATVRPPDGSAHDVTFTYSGVKTVSRTAKVATSYNTATGTATKTSAATTETYDRQGRLAQVAEPNGAVTKYEYDVGGRLRRVCQGASGSVCGQERVFTYDNRGFLLSEKHPEKGATGNGTVLYRDLDSQGNARRTTDGPNDLTFTFDKAGRVTEIREWAGAQRLLKTFTYGSDNPAGNPRNGKLLEAKRYNYPVLNGTSNTALVTEGYTYGGLEGRASQRTTSLTLNGTANETFTQSFVYNTLGQLQAVNYPQCAFAACASTSRSVTNSYANGWLTAVNNYTGTVPGQTVGVGITYHANGMVHQAAHGNGVVVTQANDPNGMIRPASIAAAKDGVTLWSTGAYQYDGAGNIWKMGPSWFDYDSLSRVEAGAVFPDPLGTGTQRKQSYTFDNYGNLQSITTQVGTGSASTRNTPASASTNRLTGAVAYDAAGNLTSWNGAVYEYDAFNQMKRMASGTEEWHYIYTADDERFWSFKPASGGNPRFDRWTLRGLDGKVLREFANAGYTWTAWEDYIYRDSLLLAGYLSNGQRRHFHLDHLGTPRLVTNAGGNQTAYHVYYPFGEEATAFDPNTDRMKFTGHERDLGSLAGTDDDLDYMHARHYSMLTGRFGSFDPVGGNPQAPQSWNRYSYVMGRSMIYVDPQGLLAFGRVPPPVGMTLYETIHVNASPWGGTTTNPFTGVWGLNVLLFGRSFQDHLSSLRDLTDRGLGWSRNYYQNRFDQMAVEGNHLAAFIDYLGLELVIPKDSSDLGMELAMAMVPGGKLGKGFLKGPGAVREAARRLGIDPKKAKLIVERAKKALSRRGDENVWVHPKTGEIMAPETGEIVGNILE